MGGLKSFMPITWVTMWVATLAIAGIWPFAGFFSKDEIIWQMRSSAGAGERAVRVRLRVSGSWRWPLRMLTAFYMTRMMVMTFHGTNRTGDEEAQEGAARGPGR